MKNFLLAVVIASIHYSAFGNYLVNQNGKRVVILGNPEMICYCVEGERHGIFVKENGAVIWIKSGTKVIKIEKPVCDILKGK